MLITQDSKYNPQFWDMVKALGVVGPRVQSSAGTMMERISSGENLLGFNIFNSYAALRAKKDPSIGIVLPKDYALVMSRVMFISKTAKNPNAGKLWLDGNNNESPADITIDQVLADTNVMTTSDQAVADIDAQLQILKQETGITDAEIIHVPFLHQPEFGTSVAYQPGTINGFWPAFDSFATPDPHGPVIDGVDIFKDQLEKALAPLGIKVLWIEDWDLYHRLDGEVHCGTNSKRALLPDEKWWTN